MTTLDFIRDVHIYQHKNGYRFSVDALLLAEFVTMPRVRRIADFCAGSGVIGLLLARRYPAASLNLVELQRSLAKLARKNVDLNEMAGRVTVVHGDLKDLATADGRRRGDAGRVESVPADMPLTPHKGSATEAAGRKHETVVVPAKLCDLFTAETCDLIVANPPFRSLRTGRMSSGDEKAIARHELALPLKDLVAAAAFLLRHHGRFCFIHLPERLADIVSLLRAKGCEPKRLRFVHSFMDSEAKMILVEAVKNAKPGLVVEPPLCLYNEDGTHTDEIAGYYRVGEPKGETLKSTGRKRSEIQQS